MYGDCYFLHLMRQSFIRESTFDDVKPCFIVEKEVLCVWCVRWEGLTPCFMNVGLHRVDADIDGTLTIYASMNTYGVHLWNAGSYFCRCGNVDLSRVDVDHCLTVPHLPDPHAQREMVWRDSTIFAFLIMFSARIAYSYGIGSYSVRDVCYSADCWDLHPVGMDWRCLS